MLQQCDLSKRVPAPTLATGGRASSHVCLGRHGVTDCFIFYHSRFSFMFMARLSSRSRRRNLDAFFLQPQRYSGTVVTSSLVWVFSPRLCLVWHTHRGAYQHTACIAGQHRYGSLGVSLFEAWFPRCMRETQQHGLCRKQRGCS